MKKNLLLLVASLALGFNTAVAQDEKPKTDAPSQEALEAKFQKMLTKAFLSGRWSPIDNAELGQEKKEDKYEIVSASKIKDDQWVINAKMRYGKNEMVLPITVQVKWSGDTPVIIVNNLSMGGGRSYSARVLFYDGTYAGSWNSSTGYGGVLYGTVDHESKPAPKPEEPKKPDQK